MFSDSDNVEKAYSEKSLPFLKVPRHFKIFYIYGQLGTQFAGNWLQEIRPSKMLALIV